MSEVTSLSGASLAISLLLYSLREGTFYQDHDESMRMLYDAELALDALTDAALKNEPEDDPHVVRKMTTHFTATSESEIITHNLDSRDIIVSQPEFVGKFVLDENRVELGPLTVGKHYEVWIYG